MSYPEVMSEVKEAPVLEEDLPEEEHPMYRVLNAGTDRCETCGAQAFHLTVMPHGEDKLTEMVWCNHHFNKYDKLRERAVYISSQLDKLNVKPSSSSPD